MFEEGQEILDKRYRVIKKLGGGAFGEIFKGKQKITMLVYPIDALNTFKFISIWLLSMISFFPLAIFWSIILDSLSVLYLCL